MQFRKWAIGLAVLSMVGTAVVAVADDAAAPPVKSDKRAAKVDKPYSALTDLTDDQTAKIVEIQKTTAAAEKALKDKEKADILALLTPDQQKELTDISAKAEAEHKAALEAARAQAALEKANALKNSADHMGATTAPSTPK